MSRIKRAEHRMPPPGRSATSLQSEMATKSRVGAWPAGARLLGWHPRFAVSLEGAWLARVAACRWHPQRAFARRLRRFHTQPVPCARRSGARRRPRGAIRAYPDGPCGLSRSNRRVADYRAPGPAGSGSTRDCSETAFDPCKPPFNRRFLVDARPDDRPICGDRGADVSRVRLVPEPLLRSSVWSESRSLGCRLGGGSF
jgi:hypothetical protein